MTASGQQAAAKAIADRLGSAPVTFPGGHDGFLGGEYGQTGEPEAFAVALRQVLDPTGLKARSVVARL